MSSNFFLSEESARKLIHLGLAGHGVARCALLFMVIVHH
jgi:hypothetical protein